MTKEQLEYQRTLAIRVCLQGFLHSIELGEEFGPRFTEHEYIGDAISGIILQQDPKIIMRLSDSVEMETMLGVVQRHEELVLASLHGRFPDLDAREIVQQCTGYDEQLSAYWSHAYGGRAEADDLEPAEVLQDEIEKRGLADKVVVSMTKRGLRERIRERKLRRKWLRTSEGRAYLRELLRRRHSHHHIDPKRSRTARQTARLYADER